MTKINMVNNNVAILRDDAATASKGGILLPPGAAKAGRTWYGVVVAAGPGRILDSGSFRPCPVKKGDHVVFRSHIYEMEVDNTKYTVVEDTEIMAVLVEEKK